jgi:hypothetical protein
LPIPVTDAEGFQIDMEVQGELIIDDAPDTTPIPHFNPKQAWAQADTTAKKFKCLARILGLEP